MIRGIAIMGLNGCGKSTLAHTIAKRLDFYEMDVEDYYFPEQKNSRQACFLQVFFGKSCKIFLENVASPNWRKLQSLDWQLSCQPHSHCRPNLVVTA